MCNYILYGVDYVLNVKHKSISRTHKQTKPSQWGEKASRCTTAPAQTQARGPKKRAYKQAGVRPPTALRGRQTRDTHPDAEDTKTDYRRRHPTKLSPANANS